MQLQESPQSAATQGAVVGQVHQIPTNLAFIPDALVAECRSFRDACHLAWISRTRKNLTFSHLAVEIDGLYASHASEYFAAKPISSKGKQLRDLPAKHVAAVEAQLGNRAISQYMARIGRLTLLEEVIASRMV
jgi:hypothetical protein